MVPYKPHSQAFIASSIWQLTVCKYEEEGLVNVVICGDINLVPRQLFFAGVREEPGNEASYSDIM